MHQKKSAMKLIAHIPAQTEMRVVTEFLRSIGLVVRYKNGQLIAQGRRNSRPGGEATQ